MKQAPSTKHALAWAGPGEVNAGFAFLLDCVVNLFVLSALLAAFGFPMEIIKTRIIPGALVGIILGNFAMVWIARRRARITGNAEITAMPLGLDLTTTVGFTIAVLGPLFLSLRAELGSAEEAATIAWYVGMAGTIWMGLIKAGLSFLGPSVQRILPLPALLGSMVGIAVVWLGANAILETFTLPEVGLASLAIMAYALIAGHRLPYALPGAVIAILAGTLLYYGLGEAGLIGGYSAPGFEGLGLAIAVPSLGGIEALFGRSLFYMAVIVPFALLIAASTVNLTAGANILGDEYDSRNLMRADAAATVAGALFGSVVQTTPYFGHATYKRMGARTGYSLGVALVLLVGGLLGVIRFLIDVLPDAAIKPILIVVASDIVRITFRGVKADDAPAVSLAVFPVILNFAHVKLSELKSIMDSGITATRDALSGTGAQAQAGLEALAAMVPEGWLQSYQLLGAMSRGYILTGLLWAASVAYIIHGRFRAAALTLFLAAGLSLTGIIHSVLDTSAIYWPWQLENLSDYLAGLPYRFAAGYGLAGLIILGLGLWYGKASPAGPSSVTLDVDPERKPET